MPRPKKPGAPEPKKRSRNGCWPCKHRKVKCDEGRPTCQNCQRQGETCDYNIRLNWEGRGRRTPDAATSSPGQTSFSVGTVSTGSGRPGTVDSGTTTTSKQIQFQAASIGPQPQTRHGAMNSPIPRSGHAFATEYRTPHAPGSRNPTLGRLSDTSLIDPALMDDMASPTAMYQNDFYAGRPEQQYAQSYERHRSITPITSSSAQLPEFPRLRAQDLEVLGGAGARGPGANATMRSLALQDFDSPTSTSFDIKDLKNSASLELQDVDRPAKRARYQSSNQNMPPPNTTTDVAPDPLGATFDNEHLMNSVGTPLTSVPSHDDEGFKPLSSTIFTRESLDLRRLSVSSLLSGPAGMPRQKERDFSTKSNSEVEDWSLEIRNEYQDTTTWGTDRGFKDLDIGKNDDANAISGSSPVAIRDHLDLVIDSNGEFMPVEFGFGMETSTAFDSGGYYDKPVPICIPRALEPLPTKLLENPMNLLYFHHFLHHTAGCLIPHNCSSNPFKMILPQMAVQDDNLLNLLLAYSASHRARLLRQPEPATRIALWVQDIFPNLRHALDNPSEIVSDSNLATAIMLASLEIISPKAFGVEVPWQKHLETARQMIAARGGPQRMENVSRGDKVSSFLWSWFAYLDVLGSLSGGRLNSTSSIRIWDFEIDEENDYQIDCILGFTSRCVRILAKIAELSRVCDGQRIGSDHNLIADWKPSEDIMTRAQTLELELSSSQDHPARPCTHMQSTGEAAYQWDSQEMAATNQAFHLAGLIHLHRRTLGKPSEHPDVQHVVREIFAALYKVRKGSSAEACLLFPMFTAGAETQDEKQRMDILERIKSIERFGMTQIHKARTLLERVWETGKPWETLVAGEFFG